MWLRYVEDTCVIWPRGLDSLQEFCYHINSLIPTFKITMKIESDSANPLLDVLVIREGTTMNIKIYRNPTHTGRYLHFQSNCPPHVKRGIVQSLYYRPNVIYQEQQVRSDEICYFKTRNSTYSSMPIAVGFCYQQTQEKCSSEEGGAAT
jgi:hypothetical protein